VLTRDELTAGEETKEQALPDPQRFFLFLTLPSISGTFSLEAYPGELGEYTE